MECSKIHRVTLRPCCCAKTLSGLNINVLFGRKAYDIPCNAEMLHCDNVIQAQKITYPRKYMCCLFVVLFAHFKCKDSFFLIVFRGMLEYQAYSKKDCTIKQQCRNFLGCTSVLLLNGTFPGHAVTLFTSIFIFVHEPIAQILLSM